MTNNRDFYQQLLKTGAPALPDNYFYKIWQSKKKMQYLYPHQEETSSRALSVEIRRKIWGGLFSVNALNGVYWYMSQSDLNNRHSNDNQTILEYGWLTEDELDGTYHLAHIALLCKQANDDRIKKEKLKATKSVDLSTYRISAFLNKRLP